MDALDRYRGSLIGLAVGDALGAPFEFRQPGSYPKVTDFSDVGGPWNLKAGEWTDDTSMALCLAESLIERHGFDPVDQLTKYLRWYHEGYMSSTGKCFDIGTTTLRGLLRYEATKEPYDLTDDLANASNGSLMRLAPVPMFYRSNPEAAIMYSGMSSKTTHGSPIAVDACRYFGGLIIGALNDVPKEELLKPKYCPIDGFWDTMPMRLEVEEVASGSFKKRGPPEIKASGYVVKTLEAALWALNMSNSFEEGCIRAVNLGDDTDTVGAVYGQLAGALYGVDGIPDRWRERLVKIAHIDSLAELLFFNQLAASN